MKEHHRDTLTAIGGWLLRLALIGAGMTVGWWLADAAFR